MTYVPRNGSPINNKSGMQDLSIPELVRNPIGDPINKPLCFTFAARGVGDEALPVVGTNAMDVYGRGIFNTRNKYTTFNTPYMAMFNANGNEMMTQRLIPDNAKRATFRTTVELVQKDVPVWQRNPDGTVVYDANGQPKSTGTTPGYVAIFRRAVIDDSDTGMGGLGVAKVLEGSETNTDGTKSKVYAIYDIEGPYEGEDCNGFGHKLIPLSKLSSPALDPSYQTAVGGRVYAMQWYETLDGVSSPVIWKTLTGLNSINFSFKPGAYYQPLRTELDFENVVADAYRKPVPDIGELPYYGPFRNFHVYHENLLAVLEEVQSLIENAPTDPYMIDIFGGLDLNGNPYDGLVVNPSTATDKMTFSGRNIHYLAGGSDGTMTDVVFDELVRREMLLFPDSGKVRYDNELKYSLGSLWDPGFSFETKEACVNFIGKSRNTFLQLATHVHNLPRNDLQAEESAKIALIELITSVPESDYYGTPASRGMVTGQTCKIRNSSWKKYVPFGYSIANFFSKYAGAGEGRYKPEARFNMGSKTIIEDIEDLSMPWKGNDVYASDWDVSLITARSYDYWRFFIPAIQGIYNEERSVLNNALFNFTMAYVYRVSDRVWADVSGEDRLTNGERAKLVESLIIERLEGRLDGVANIVPKAYFTAEDISNGYSITLDLSATGSVLLTQFNTTIRVYRRTEA